MVSDSLRQELGGKNYGINLTSKNYEEKALPWYKHE